MVTDLHKAYISTEQVPVSSPDEMLLNGDGTNELIYSNFLIKENGDGIGCGRYYGTMSGDG